MKKANKGYYTILCLKKDSCLTNCFLLNLLFVLLSPSDSLLSYLFIYANNNQLDPTTIFLFLFLFFWELDPKKKKTGWNN